MLSLGIAYRRLNLVVDSKRANQRGIAIAESEMATNPRDSYARACVAYMSARLGDRRRAEAEISQVLHAALNDLHARWIAVMTLEALGRRDDALALLESSPEGMIADAGRFPDLADLARDPRFLHISGLRRGK